MSVGRAQRTIVWSPHISLPKQACDRRQKAQQSVLLYAGHPACPASKRWRGFHPSLCWGRPHLSLSGALCSACTFTLGKRTKLCSFQVSLGPFTDSQLSPGWEPSLGLPSRVKCSTSSIAPLRSKGFSHKTLKTEFPRFSGVTHLTVWKCTSFSFGLNSVQTKCYKASHFPSLNLTSLFSTTWREGLLICFSSHEISAIQENLLKEETCRG